MNNVSYETISTPANSSFIAKKYEHPFFEAPLHIHSQYELISFDKGEGSAFVGDSVRRFNSEDFMLLGESLPHVWLSDDKYYSERTKLMSASTYAQFGANIIPQNISVLPEFSSVQMLLNRAQRGLIFHGEHKSLIQSRFRKLPDLSYFDRLISMYSVLFDLSNCDYSYLTSDQYANPMMAHDKDMILTSVYTIITQRYREDISLAEISNYVGMNPSALCRHFKNRTGKTVFEYLSETRISYAVKLLSTRNISISTVAYDCGYNNLSHFNRQFKAIVGKTPSEFRSFMGI